MDKPLKIIRFNIHNKTLFKTLFYGLFLRKCKDKQKRDIYKTQLFFNYKINLNSPRTFNEHILWLKTNYQNELWDLCADKIKCKDFLIKNGFGDFVPKTLGTYDNSNEIDLDALPEKFVLKTNHDSGSVYICDKQSTDFKVVFKKLNESLKNNYYKNTLEPVYKSIEPKIFAEELILPCLKDAGDLKDYKFFIFNGKFKFGYVASKRHTDIRFDLFEDDFKLVNCEYTYLQSPKNKKPEKPSNFNDLKDLAEKVGSLFDFARVDLYNSNEGPKIGEITFYSMSGFGPFTKKEYDFKYGKFFEEIPIFSKQPMAKKSK